MDNLILRKCHNYKYILLLVSDSFLLHIIMSDINVHFLYLLF
jgi:hypothetical protein